MVIKIEEEKLLRIINSYTGSLILLNTHTNVRTSTHTGAHTLQRLIHYRVNPLNLLFPGKEYAYWVSLVIMLKCTQNMPVHIWRCVDTPTDSIMNYWLYGVINSSSVLPLCSKSTHAYKISSSQWLFHSRLGLSPLCVCVCETSVVVDMLICATEFVNSKVFANRLSLCVGACDRALGTTYFMQHIRFTCECRGEKGLERKRWWACAKCRNWDTGRLWNSIRSGAGEETFMRVKRGGRWNK